MIWPGLEGGGRRQGAGSLPKEAEVLPRVSRITLEARARLQDLDGEISGSG